MIVGKELKQKIVRGMPRSMIFLVIWFIFLYQINFITTLSVTLSFVVAILFLFYPDRMYLVSWQKKTPTKVLLQGLFIVTPLLSLFLWVLIKVLMK